MEEYGRPHKRYEKDHPRELQAVLDNLDTYFKPSQKADLGTCRAFVSELRKAEQDTDEQADSAP